MGFRVGGRPIKSTAEAGLLETVEPVGELAIAGDLNELPMDVAVTSGVALRVNGSKLSAGDAVLTGSATTVAAVPA